MQSPQSRSQGITPLPLPWWWQGKWTVGYVRVRESGEGERDRENAGGQKFFFFCLCASRERRRSTMLFQITPFCAFFYWTIHETKSFWTKRAVSFKRKWLQRRQFPNQSLICDLFNQVFNCKFDFKNQFNCILAKFKCQL